MHCIVCCIVLHCIVVCRVVLYRIVVSNPKVFGDLAMLELRLVVLVESSISPVGTRTASNTILQYLQSVDFFFSRMLIYSFNQQLFALSGGE